jgi:hypothetical protein
LIYFDLKDTITPILNGLSEHDAQLLIISTDYSHTPIQKSKIIRKIIMTLLINLCNESWDIILNIDDVSTVFNSF